METKEKSIATKMRMPDWMLKDYAEAAKRNSYEKLTNIITEIKEYDLRSKGVNNNSTEHGGLLKELIFKILH